VHPVLFVVAQTIEDANAVAERLAADDLLPGEGRVLVITSESSDVALGMLARVEEPDSPVRAIVSVNKLREGWDVKNIGVVLALRALASETLTEQVMGRGLRLPFGRRTGVPAIDQLDLVAHESYAQLLRAKDALLERLVGAEAGASRPDEERPIVLFETGAGAAGDGGAFGLGMPVAGSPSSVGLDGVGLAEILLAQEQGALEAQAVADERRLGEAMPRNAGLAPIEFPRERFEYAPPAFSLASLRLVDVEQRGSRYRTEPEVRIIRRAIQADRDVLGEVRVREERVESAEATVQLRSADEVRAGLVRRLLGSGLVAAELDEQARAVELVDAFLRGAGVERDGHYEWSADLADRADAALFGLVEAAYRANRARPAFTWDPVLLPPRRPMPLQTQDKNAPEAAFRVGAWYGEWTRGVERYAQLDSATAEFRLAKKLDDWDGVDRWLRLYVHGDGWIRWFGGRYFPDFVVVAVDGAQWIVEAKSDKAATDSAEVAQKAEAAREWVQRVNASRRFGTWGYLLVTETQIAAAASWEALVRAAR